jgi:hypothetical protein
MPLCSADCCQGLSHLGSLVDEPLSPLGGPRSKIRFKFDHSLKEKTYLDD